VTNNSRTLPQIAKAIKALEKKDIRSAIEKGKLLEEASKKCDHGQYMEWLKTEFGWSHSTSLRYRSVHNLSQNRQFGDFAKLNISISAVYLLANSDVLVRNAIIKAAKSGRVSYRIALDILEKWKHPEPNPPPPPAKPDSPSDSAEESDEESPTDDDTKEQLIELTELVNGMLDTSNRIAELTQEMSANDLAKIDVAKLHKSIRTLQAVYDAHAEKSAVKAAADRAADRAEEKAARH
jgi:hypothetical protein